MSPAPEIITLQLGGFANFVGAHFWNLQDEAVSCSSLEEWAPLAAGIDQEVVCAWSEDRHGVATYCPRVVAVDLSGALGGVSFSPDTPVSSAAAMSAAGGIAAGTWGGGVEVHRVGEAAKSHFRRQLEAAVALDTDDPDALAAHQEALEAAALELHGDQPPQHWTDYLQVDLQPSTALVMPGVWQGQPGWDGWGPGAADTSAARDTAEAAADRVRWWAEQCDHLQGLQVFADDLGGWGGFGLGLLQELREQYPSQPVIYFSLQQREPPRAAAASAAAAAASASGRSSSGGGGPASRRLLGQCLSVAEVTQVASLYVPLVPPGGGGGSGGGTSGFADAALLAAAIDTATLPLRCPAAAAGDAAVLGGTDMHSLAHLLAGPAANLAALSLQLPAGQLPAAGAPSGTGAGGPALSLDDRGAAAGASAYALSAGVAVDPALCLAESLTLRGAHTPAGVAASGAAKQALDALLLQRQQLPHAVPCVSHTCISRMPLPLPLSFPGRLCAGGPAPAAAAAAASGGGGVGGRERLPRPLLLRPGAPPAPAPSALSRLTASRGFEQRLQDLGQALRRGAGSLAGRACLEDWGYQGGDVEELGERLLQLAGRYAEEE